MCVEEDSELLAILALLTFKDQGSTCYRKYIFDSFSLFNSQGFVFSLRLSSFWLFLIWDGKVCRGHKTKLKDWDTVSSLASRELQTLLQIWFSPNLPTPEILTNISRNIVKTILRTCAIFTSCFRRPNVIKKERWKKSKNYV